MMLKKIRGEVEIIGTKNGKTIYYDKGENIVTSWAKHATMHLLTGDSFAQNGATMFGGTHNVTTDGSGLVTAGSNTDGCMVSGEQYFFDDKANDFWWSESTRTSPYIYPFFPVKMLFGTGKEFDTYSELSADEEDEWESQSSFEDNIPLAATASNNYSNVWDTGELIPQRTVNDALSQTLTDTLSAADFGISGAVKVGEYHNFSSSSLLDVDGNLVAAQRGIGYPAFIYSNREATFEAANSEVMLTADDTYENKITFTVVMPEQTGTQAGLFYPYNEYFIKEVGLFADARLFLEDNPTSNELYDKMPYGLMFAKRYVAPFFKTADSSFTIRWTIYL